MRLKLFELQEKFMMGGFLIKLTQFEKTQDQKVSFLFRGVCLLRI